MINPDSRTIEWMRQVANEVGFSDITLIEKSIRAFSLLESLVLSGCPFVKLVKRISPHNVPKAHAKFFYQVSYVTGADTEDISQVLDDIFQTSLCICLQGLVDSENFKQLQEGIKHIQSFIHGEKYRLDSAIVNASKAAYLSAMIAANRTEIKHFDRNDIQSLQNAVIEIPLPTKLNKLKKSNIEAFFYWHEISKLTNNKKIK
ncbi:hypothetical protein AGMMS49982_16700 [Bacteroidia bacterium]|nr:hypothetical protein AGMMS49982_16700 [Bacteroidia bacterium]